MKRLSVVLALVLVAPVLAQAPPRKSRWVETPPQPAPVLRPALAPGDPAPDLAGVTLAGERISVRWGERALTIVNFWATWCQPCKSEMPLLQDLWARREKDGLGVWGIEVDDGQGRPRLEDAKRFVAELGIRYPVMHEDAGTSANWGGISILPTTFLVARDGKIVRKYVGATTSQTEGLVSDANAILDGRPLGKQALAPPSETKPPSQ